jgi:hypothetical protein
MAISIGLIVLQASRMHVPKWTRDSCTAKASLTAYSQLTACGDGGGLYLTVLLTDAATDPLRPDERADWTVTDADDDAAGRQ